MKREIKKHLRRRAIVNLKTGEAFGGVLFAADSEVFILREAQLLDVGNTGQAVGIDGELLLFRPDISYVQLPG